MKWKITSRFVLTIIIVVVLVTIINIIALIGIIINIGRSSYLNDGNDINSIYSTEEFVRNFKDNIIFNDSGFDIDDSGKNYLNEKGIWIQIIDEESKELYSYNASNLPKSYTPFELIHAYKYSGVINGSEIFIGEKKLDNQRLTYIMGFDRDNIRKYVFIYENSQVYDGLNKLIKIVLVADTIIACIFAYIFSIRLTKPLGEIIGFVEKLESGDYNVYKNPKGIYFSIYNKVNNLSQTLRENEIQRKKLNRMRDEWIANISHDIKTPLASIRGYAELLSDEHYEFSIEEIRSYGQIINNKSEYIRVLVDDLNLSTRLKNKDIEIKKTELNIVSLVKETIIDILNDPKYKDRNINFESDYESLKITGDKILLKRLINNLIYNSLIHNEEDTSIDIIIRKEDKIKILIKDDGKGIKKEDLEFIFERYYRGTDTGERHKGSGLGMAIAKDIVSAHNGKIKIDSELKRGTIIEIEF